MPKKILALAIAVAGSAFTEAANYGEALQKSIFFYESQQSGALPSWNRNPWRGDSALTDGADNNVDLTGGWYDAGDHVKFGFPMAASATMLAWGVIENPDAYQQTNQLVHIQNNLRFVADYFIKAHTAPNEFYGQVGTGSVDHAWWGSAEVMPMARPSYKIDANSPGSDLAGETAAALAAIALVFQDSDPDYAATLLTHAKQLYTFADTYRGQYSDAITDAKSFYNSWSGYQDELVWGALWLYQATNDPDYLNKAIEEYQHLNTNNYTWGHSWDDKSYGSYILLAKLTGESQYEVAAERWLDYWTVGYQGERINYTPGGLAYLDTWGAARYASNSAFLALIYSDYLKTKTPVGNKANDYYDFAVSQLEYLLGDNPMNMSYLIGYGDVFPTSPHHRTAHGSWSNSLELPQENRHTLIGALVGGPGADDSFQNDRGDYIKNEVATDYNAAFTGALARLWKDFGGEPLDETFANNVDEIDDEFFVEAKVNANGPRFIEIAAIVHNRSAWPARNSEALKFRYWIDLKAEMAAGYSAEDITISTAYSQASGVSELRHWQDDVYYVEVSFEGVDIFPGGQSESKKEVQFRLSLPSNSNEPQWENASDPSWDNYTNQWQRTDKIALYEGDSLIWGTEPTQACDADSSSNCPPTAEAISVETAHDTPITVVLKGFDSDGEISEYRLDTQPSFGTLTQRNNEITYQPNAGFSGEDTFRYLVIDEQGASSVPATVTVQVEPSAAAGVIINAPENNAILPLNAPVNLALTINNASGANIYVNNELVENLTGTGLLNIAMTAPSLATTWTVQVMALDELNQEIGSAETITLNFEERVDTPSSVECTLADIHAWNSGFVLNPIILANQSDAPIEGWSVEIEFNEPITLVNSWNTHATLSSDGKTLHASHLNYNALLAPGSQTSFGIQGGHEGIITQPRCSIK